MAELLFAYGTLQDLEVQKEVIGRVVKSEPDTLLGFRKSEVEIDGKVYPRVIEDARSEERITGHVLHVETLDLKSLDEYETDTYRRQTVILDSGKTVWIYVK